MEFEINVMNVNVNSCTSPTFWHHTVHQKRDYVGNNTILTHLQRMLLKNSLQIFQIFIRMLVQVLFIGLYISCPCRDWRKWLSSPTLNDAKAKEEKHSLELERGSVKKGCYLSSFVVNSLRRPLLRWRWTCVIHSKKRTLDVSDISHQSNVLTSYLLASKWKMYFHYVLKMQLDVDNEPYLSQQ